MFNATARFKGVAQNDSWACSFDSVSAQSTSQRTLPRCSLRYQSLNEKDSNTHSKGCMYGKKRWLPFKMGERTIEIGQQIHTDVCGPMETSTVSGSRYFVTFKDEFSGYCVIRLLSA